MPRKDKQFLPATQNPVQIVIEDSRGTPQNLAYLMDAARIRAAVDNAESGRVDDLWSLFQGVLAGDSWIQGLLATRKLSVLNDVIRVEPTDPKAADDVVAAADVQSAILGVPDFRRVFLSHLLDSVVLPVSVSEKIYLPDQQTPGRFRLHRLVAVPHFLEDFRTGTIMLRRQDERGAAIDDVYPIDPRRHVVHRGNLLNAPDNWGGPMRSLLVLWLVRTCNREWWARNAERWGMPFPVGKYPAGDTTAKASLQNAFSNALRIGGMVVSDQTTIDLIEASGSSNDAFERLQKWAERQIQIAIVGQDLSSSSAPTGMNSGVATLQGQVRDDMTAFDSQMIGQTLTDHLAKPHLAINGLRGSCRVEIGAASNLRALCQLASVLPSYLLLGLNSPTTVSRRFLVC